jgi:hypothetical protein
LPIVQEQGSHQASQSQCKCDGSVAPLGKKVTEPMLLSFDQQEGEHRERKRQAGQHIQHVARPRHDKKAAARDICHILHRFCFYNPLAFYYDSYFVKFIFFVFSL